MILVLVYDNAKYNSDVTANVNGANAKTNA